LTKRFYFSKTKTSAISALQLPLAACPGLQVLVGRAGVTTRCQWSSRAVLGLFTSKMFVISA